MNALSPHQDGLNIPYAIYDPLLQIAKHGYHADAIKYWYTALLSQLLQPDGMDANILYPANLPYSHAASTLVQNLERTISYSGDESAVGSNADSNQTPEISAVDSAAWNTSFSLDGFTTQELPTTTALSIQPTYATNLDINTNLSPAWSPRRPASISSNGPIAFSTPVNGSTQFTPDDTDFPPWSYAESSLSNSTSNTPSQKRKASQSPTYEFPVSSAVMMPLLVPTAESALPVHSSLLHPGIDSSAQMTYLPISIIPARKRKKAGSKGVKEFIQPVHVPRQSE